MFLFLFWFHASWWTHFHLGSTLNQSSKHHIYNSYYEIDMQSKANIEMEFPYLYPPRLNSIHNGLENMQ